jgi:hypothetical protein
MSFITVTNNGDKTLRGPQVRFNGIPYEFPAGERVTISFDAAKHIFGIGAANKDDVLSKHGWMQYAADRDAAMAQLGLFSFGSPDDPIPEPVKDLVPEKPIPPVEDEIIVQDSEFVAVNEQRSAPLQAGTGGETEIVGADNPVVDAEPPEPVLGKGSMLDNLGI